MNALRFAILATFALLPYGRTAAAGPQPFAVYDNMFFAGRPSPADCGLVASNIIYGGDIWPSYRDYGALPSREAYAAIVAAHSTAPGPVVIDIERMPFTGPRALAERRLHVLATLADWTRAAVHGRLVGFFGYNTLTDVKPKFRDLARELARHVNAFFPALYANSDDRTAWMQRADDIIRQYRAYAGDKPIYFYLWPQYNAHTPRQFEWIGRDFWRFQLDRSRRLAAGVVIWGTRYAAWNVTSGWWAATADFIRRLHVTSRVPGGGSRAKPGGLAEAGPQVY